MGIDTVILIGVLIHIFLYRWLHIYIFFFSQLNDGHILNCTKSLNGCYYLQSSVRDGFFFKDSILKFRKIILE